MVNSGSGPTMWFIEDIQISGGFLPGLTVKFPKGLTCIIGPRGSGKSTLAEALRFALQGATGASRTRLDLIQANIGLGTTVTVNTNNEAGQRYTVRRGYKQAASLIGSEGQVITSVDLDRGTFLPLDAYTGREIEDIADEALGEKRRALLDELKADRFRQIQLAISEHRRRLESNAARLRAAEQKIADVTEQIEELGDPEAKLKAMGPVAKHEASGELLKATRQGQCNAREKRNLDRATKAISEFGDRLDELDVPSQLRLSEEGSANAAALSQFESQIDGHFSAVADLISEAQSSVTAAREAVEQARRAITIAQGKQDAELSRLSQISEAANERVRERAAFEQQLLELQELRSSRASATGALMTLREERKTLRAKYLEEIENLSSLRAEVATILQNEAGKNVRIRVIRNADVLPYQQLLANALRGARVRNHDEILESLLTIRPEHLAQFVQTNDALAFESLMNFGTERSARILEAFKQNIDPLDLEVVPVEDGVRIELNVSPSGSESFKDASELSRGQKCTALLPILLARRDSPLIIDQPEDNLDNHFIYETVVNSICRLKNRRQMIFITHNANIPVLADAELVLVLNSDGKIGYVEKFGGVDSCRDEIIDLLEGGRRAFDLRRKRYDNVARN
jgi:DNA repair exonuclease SbcCD ATPase subunit